MSIVSQLSGLGQFEEFAKSYGMLSTIAGKGEMDNSGQIGWLAEYESGNAVDAELTRPHFAMADSAGNIYIADKDAHGIRKVTPEGIISTVAGTNVAGYNGDGPGTECQLNAPNGMWVKADGTVYILDLGNDKIRRLDTTGNLVTLVDDTIGISLGRGLWVTPGEDTIYYASGSQIKIWTQSKGFVTYASGFSGLGNITQDKNGFIVATDRSANRVYRISKDGTTKETIAGNGAGTGGGDGFSAVETGLDGVRGVWFLEDNSYFVATHSGSQIWYIDPHAKIHLFLDGRNGDEYHSGDGENYRTPGYKISEPRSVSVDYKGNILITENDKGYIRKIENDYTYYYTSFHDNRNSLNSSIVFPNPFHQQIQLQFPEQVTESAIIIVHDISGRVAFEEEIYIDDYRTSIPIRLDENFEPGLYILSVISEGNLILKHKIVKLVD